MVTLKEGHELIRSGPYRRIRHPIYTGILLAFLGTAIAIGRVAGLVAFVIVWASFWMKARREESFLAQEFGAAIRGAPQTDRDVPAEVAADALGRMSWGRLGVEALDDVGVLLLDDAALELERVGELAAVEGEVAFEQGKALDGLVLRQVGGEARDFGFDELVHPGMCEQFGGRGECDVFSRARGLRWW